VRTRTGWLFLLGFLVAGTLIAAGLSPTSEAAIPAPSAARGPIIDVHLHAFHAWTENGGKWPWPEWLPPDYLPAPKTDADLMRESLAMLKRLNIVKAVVSGSTLDAWRAAAPGLVIPGFMTGIAGTTPEQLATLRKDLASGRFAVIGEVLSQYHGLTPNDPPFEPFLAMAETLDKPMTVHMGLGAPGNVQFRMGLSDPLLFEDALVKHPKLRLCVCHAGWPLLDRMIALLYYYPNVYVDTAFIDWYLPRKEFHGYLRRLVEAGYAKRIMFGTDLLYWPESIRLAVESIETADFLSPGQKRDILYNNAARFLRLDAAGK
jgi:predicted TIM-barrel fold metal-dependent hydrolase